jgi:hypothetical protein
MPGGFEDGLVWIGRVMGNVERANVPANVR